jgi:hypothetical protein
LEFQPGSQQRGPATPVITRAAGLVVSPVGVEPQGDERGAGKRNENCAEFD